MSCPAWSGSSSRALSRSAGTGRTPAGSGRLCANRAVTAVGAPSPRASPRNHPPPRPRPIPPIGRPPRSAYSARPPAAPAEPPVGVRAHAHRRAAAVGDLDHRVRNAPAAFLADDVPLDPRALDAGGAGGRRRRGGDRRGRGRRGRRRGRARRRSRASEGGLAGAAAVATAAEPASGMAFERVRAAVSRLEGRTRERQQQHQREGAAHTVAVQQGGGQAPRRRSAGGSWHGSRPGPWFHRRWARSACRGAPSRGYSGRGGLLRRVLLYSSPMLTLLMKTVRPGWSPGRV